MGKIIATPDGNVEFPDDMPMEKITDVLRDRYQGSVGPLRAGTAGLTSDVMTGGAKILSGLGMPEWSKGVEQGATERHQTAERFQPKRWEDVHGISDALQYGYENLAESVPEFAPAMAGAAAGATPGAIAGTAVGGPFGTIVGGALGAMGGAALASLPQMFGRGVREQMDQGKSLPETSGTEALGYGALQAGSTGAMFGVPEIKAISAAPAIIRAVARGVENGVIGGLSGAASSAIDQAYKDPEKFWSFDPSVQQEIYDAAASTGLFGGVMGAAHGAFSKRHVEPPKPPLNIPQEAGNFPTEGGTAGLGGFGTTYEPPPIDFGPERGGPSGVGPEGGPLRPSPDQGPLPPANSPYGFTVPDIEFPEPGPVPTMGYEPDDLPTPYPPSVLPPSSPSAQWGFGLEGQEGSGFNREPIQANPQPPVGGYQPGPETPPTVNFTPPEATREPGAPPSSSTGDEIPGNDSLPGVTPSERRGAQKVYKNVMQQLLAVGHKPQDAMDNALIWRNTMLRFAKATGRDPWDVYQDDPLKIINGEDGDKVLVGGKTFNQGRDKNIQPYDATNTSMLMRAAREAPMKEGTPEQWKNYFLKRGVKPDEMEWSGTNDLLKDFAGQGGKISRETIQQRVIPYDLQKTQMRGRGVSYPGYTLDGEGQRPDSFYTETVLHEGPGTTRSPNDNFIASHFGDIKNPLVFYTTTQRLTPEGESALLMEHTPQSDWHQKGRKVGYNGVVDDTKRKIALARQEWQDGHRRLALLDREWHAAGAPGGTGVFLTEVPRNALADEALPWRDRFAEAHQRIRNARATYDLANAMKREGVPNAPYKDSWRQLAMRNLVMDAINGNHDYAAWTTGKQIGDINGHGPERLAAHEKNNDEYLVNYMNKLGKPYGAKVEKIKIHSTGSNYDPERAARAREAAAAIRAKFPEWTASRDAALATAQEHPEGGRSRAVWEDSARKWQGLIDQWEDEARVLDAQAAMHETNNAIERQVWGMKIPPAMREVIGNAGLPMFQKKLGEGVARAQIRFGDFGAPTVVKLMANADKSSFMHESAHYFLEAMRRYAIDSKDVAQDLHEVHQWLGVKDPNNITEAQHEKFARGWEQYLRSGKAQSPGLADVFKRFALWLRGIYRKAEQLKVKVPDNIMRVFDRLTDYEKASSPKEVEQAVQKAKLPKAKSFYEKPGRMPKLDRETFSQPPIRQSPQDNLRDFAREVKKRYGDKGFFVRDNTNTGTGGTRYGRVMFASRDKDGVLREKPVGFQVRFADHGEADSFGKSNISVDDTSGNSVEKALMLLHHHLTGEGEPPVITHSRLDPKTQIEYKGQAVYNRRLALAGKFPYDQNIQWRPTKWGLKPLEQSPIANATSLYNRIKNLGSHLFDPFSEVENADMYRKLRNLGKGGNWRALTKAENMTKAAFDGMDQDTMKRAGEYLETPGASTGMIPSKWKEPLADLKRFINVDLREALIKAKILRPETAAAHDDSYLPRVYLRHILEGKGLIGSGMRMNLDALKKRKELTLDERLQLGEADPKTKSYYGIFRPLRNLAMMDFLGKVSENSDWVLPRSITKWNGESVTPFWLKSEAANMRERLIPAMRKSSTEKADAMEEIAQRMVDTADAALKDMPADVPQGWAKIPDTNEYGPLRGMIVKRQIAEDIQGTANWVNPNNMWDKLFGDQNSALSKSVTAWKFMKVPANPPSQVRNVIGNYLLQYFFGDIPMHRIFDQNLAAMKDRFNGGKYTQIAREHGIGMTTFNEQELYHLKDALAKMEANNNSGYLGWRNVAKFMLTQGKRLGDLHQFMEESGKIAIIKHAMENGVSADDAVIKANHALFDYSEVSSFIKGMRRSPIGSPFVCVDTKTEILTQRGWLTADEVKIGDMAASFSMEDERLYWKQVIDLYRSPYDGEMVHVVDRHLDMLMTPEHRVVTYRRRRTPGKRTINAKYLNLEIQQAQHLSKADHIPVAAPFAHVPRGEPISDAFAEFLGWYIAEGMTHKKCGAVYLFQNEGKKADQIRDMLRRNNFSWSERYRTTGGGFRRKDASMPTHVKFYIKADHGKIVRSVCPDKKLSPDMVMRMTVPQLRLFIDAFIAGDGSIGKDGRQVLIQKDLGTLDALQMALTILGESYGFYHRPTASMITIRSGKKYCIKRATRKRVNYRGDIWCPKVADTATWVARRNGKVFITHNTWTYKITPMLAELALKRKTKLLPFIAAAYAYPSFVAASNNISTDDVETLRQSLSKNLRRRNDMYLLPFKNDAGKWEFLDIGYFMPWQSPVDMARSLGSLLFNVGTGRTGEAIDSASDLMQSSNLFQNPIFSFASALTTGMDPFTGSQIANKNDPPWKQVRDYLSYGVSTAAPSILASYGAAGRLYDRATGQGVNRYGEPPDTYGMVAGRALGLNTYAVEPDAQRGRNIKSMQREIQDERSRLTYTLRDQSLTPEQRRNIIEEFRSDMQQKQQNLLQYIRASQMSPKLRAATT